MGWREGERKKGSERKSQRTWVHLKQKISVLIDVEGKSIRVAHEVGGKKCCGCVCEVGGRWKQGRGKNQGKDAFLVFQSYIFLL